MNLRKTLSLVLAVIAVSALLVGSIGFGTAAAERGVSVDVVADDRALIGYDSADMAVTDGDRVEIVTVTNRLHDDVSVTDVSVDAESLTFENPSEPTLAPGERAPIEGTVDCQAGVTETVEVTVSLEGGGVMAAIYGDTVTREFDVTCEQPDPTAQFRGPGNFQLIDAPDAAVDVTYWTTTMNESQGNQTFTKASMDDFQTNRSYQSQAQAPESVGVVAVYVEEYNTTYLHPGLDLENESVDSWAGGPAETVAGEIDLGS